MNEAEKQELPEEESFGEMFERMHRFRLTDYENLLRGLPSIANPVDSRVRISSQSIHSSGAVIAGDFVVGSYKTRPGLYTTDSDLILSRSNLPYSGGLYSMEGWDSIFHQLCAVVGLGRLQNIAQLSLLGYPVTGGESVSSMTFGHNRFIHTCDVYTIGMLMAHNCGVSGKDKIALAIALAIHDLFTPAGGDLLKFVDYERFDEDARLSDLLNEVNFVKMCQQLGVEAEEVIRICQEKDGLLCSIRDCADTLAYTARDLSMLISPLWDKCPTWYDNKEEQILFMRLWVLSRDESLLSIWEDVRANSKGQLVFSKPERLQKFLFVRACMFRLLYYNKQTRNAEYLLGIRIIKILLVDGKIKLEDFEGDRGIDSMIWFSKILSEVGYNPGYMHDGSLAVTHEFHSLENARIFVQDNVDPTTCGLIYTWPSQTKSKVSYWRIEDGSEDGVPWGEAFPEEAAEIERHMQMHAGYFVIIFKKERLQHMKEEYWLKLKSMQYDIL